MTEELDQVRDSQADAVVAPKGRYLVRNEKGRYCKGCRKVHDYLTIDCVPAAWELEQARKLVAARHGGHWELPPDGLKVVLA